MSVWRIRVRRLVEALVDPEIAGMRRAARLVYGPACGAGQEERWAASSPRQRRPLRAYNNWPRAGRGLWVVVVAVGGGWVAGGGYLV